MKQAVVTAACRGTTGTQDFTDAIFSSDVKFAHVAMSTCTAAGTAAAHARVSIGLTDGTNQGAVAIGGLDAVTPTDWSNELQTSNVVKLIDDDAVTIATGTASFVSTGLRITWTTVSGAGELVTVTLIGGSDVEASVVSGSFSTTSTITVSHLLSAAPDVLIGLTHAGSLNTQGGIGRFSLGFYDRVGATYANLSGYRNTGVASEGAGEVKSTSYLIAENSSGSTITWNATVSNFDADSFDITPSATAATDGFVIGCLRVTSGVYKVGEISTPTSTGNVAAVSGMSGAPSAVLFIDSNLTSANSVSDPAGTVGVASCVNNNGSTQQGAVSCSVDVAANPTVEKSLADAKALMVQGIAGTAVVQSTVHTWDSGGVTLNYSVVPVTARLQWYLAIGGSAVVAGPSRLTLLGVG